MYKIDTRRLVYFEEIDDSGTYGASGNAFPWIDDDSTSLSDSGEADDDGSVEPEGLELGKQRLCLSGILEVNVHHPDDPNPLTFRLNP